MKELLEKLRQQPDAEKRSIAFFGSFALTAFLVTSLLVLPSPQEKKENQANRKSLLSPFDAITHSLSLGAAGAGERMGENFSAVKETVENLRKESSLAQKSEEISSSSPADSAESNPNLDSNLNSNPDSENSGGSYLP